MTAIGISRAGMGAGGKRGATAGAGDWNEGAGLLDG